MAKCINTQLKQIDWLNQKQQINTVNILARMEFERKRSVQNNCLIKNLLSNSDIMIIIVWADSLLIKVNWVMI